MTDKVDLDALDALEAAATPGPWCYSVYGDENRAAVGVALGDYDQPIAGKVTHEDYNVAEPVATDIEGEDNAALIAALRNAYPALSAEIRALRAALKAIANNYANQNVSHENYRVIAHEVATDALAAIDAALKEPT